MSVPFMIFSEPMLATKALDEQFHSDSLKSIKAIPPGNPV